MAIARFFSLPICCLLWLRPLQQLREQATIPERGGGGVAVVILPYTYTLLDKLNLLQSCHWPDLIAANGVLLSLTANVFQSMGSLEK